MQRVETANQVIRQNIKSQVAPLIGLQTLTAHNVSLPLARQEVIQIVASAHAIIPVCMVAQSQQQENTPAIVHAINVNAVRQRRIANGQALTPAQAPFPQNVATVIMYPAPIRLKP